MASQEEASDDSTICVKCESFKDGDMAYLCFANTWKDYVTGKVRYSLCVNINTAGKCSDFKLKDEKRDGEADVDSQHTVAPEPSTPMPPCALIREDSGSWCPTCGSSQKYRWVFFPTGKCIQPKCENYYGRKPTGVTDGKTDK